MSIIRDLKMNFRKVTRVSSPHKDWCHIRLSWQIILTTLTHANAASVEELAKSMSLPLVFFPRRESLSLWSHRADLKGLQSWRGKPFSVLKTHPTTSKQINTALVLSAAKTTHPLQHCSSPCITDKAASWIAPVSLMPWSGTKQEAHR